MQNGGSYETPPVAWDQNSQDELPKLNAMAKKFNFR